MGKVIEGIPRGQMVLFNYCLEDSIRIDSEVRVIAAYVDSLELEELEIYYKRKKGTNFYDPKLLLALYLYGYKKGVRSSRKLADLCYVNIEVMWLVKNIKPDFRTIANFRKDKKKLIKEVFRDIVIVCSNLDLISGNFSQDGTKIKAVNSKDKNYTVSKLDDRIKKVEEKIEKYLKELDEMDKKDKSHQEKLVMVKDLKKRKKTYKEMINYMEKNQVSQISLTDPDSKLMKDSKGGYDVSYNVQVLVDMESHIVSNFSAGNNPADVGSMNEFVANTKKMLGLEEEVVTNTTDKGYYESEDMVKCLESGVIPEVTPQKGKEDFLLEIQYEKTEVSEEMRKSTKAEDIRKVLRNGEIPEVYKDYISDIKIQEKTEIQTVREIDEEIQKEMTDENLRDLAMKEKCYVRNLKNGKVFCPEGEILRKKSDNKGREKYCNKLACRRCKNPCTESKTGYKEVMLESGQIVSGKKEELKKRYNGKKRRKEVKKIIVEFRLRPNQERIKKRMGTSEHPHGTMKRTDGFNHFLMKGQEKVETELALYYSESNLRRMVNIKGISKVIEYLKGRKEVKIG